MKGAWLDQKKVGMHSAKRHSTITWPQLTDLSETQNQERYPGYDPTCKIWLMCDDRKGSAKVVNFGLLLVLSFFVHFA